MIVLTVFFLICPSELIDQRNFITNLFGLFGISSNNPLQFTDRGDRNVITNYHSSNFNYNNNRVKFKIIFH